MTVRIPNEYGSFQKVKLIVALDDLLDLFQRQFELAPVDVLHAFFL